MNMNGMASHVMVNGIIWRCRCTIDTCEAVHGETVVKERTAIILGISEDRLNDLSLRRQLAVRTRHLERWLNPYCLKIKRSGQFK